MTNNEMKKYKDEINKIGEFVVDETIVYPEWNCKYEDKNIRFFHNFINCSYDELILAIDGDCNSYYYDLLILRKDDEDYVIPMPVFIKSIFVDDDEWKEFNNSYTSGIVWEDIYEDIQWRTFNQLISRKEYYEEKEMKENKNKISKMKELIQEGYIELPDSYNADNELYTILTLSYKENEEWDGNISLIVQLKKEWGGDSYIQSLSFEKLITLINECY